MARRGQNGWICTRESNDVGKTPRFAPVRNNVKDDGGKKAEVIIKTDKVSDVGRLFNSVENGLKVLAKVKLIYYRTATSKEASSHILFGYQGSVSRDSDIGAFYGFKTFIFK